MFSDVARFANKKGCCLFLVFFGFNLFRSLLFCVQAVRIPYAGDVPAACNAREYRWETHVSFCLDRFHWCIFYVVIFSCVLPFLVSNLVCWTAEMSLQTFDSMHPRLLFATATQLIREATLQIAKKILA